MCSADSVILLLIASTAESQQEGASNQGNWID